MEEERIDQDHSGANATPTVDGGGKEERQSLEIEKLRREVDKLGIETRLLSRNARTQILTMLIPTVTTLVAVGGLLLSLYSQNTQNKRTAEYRRADDFALLVRQFGDGKPLATVGAIDSLRSYAADPAYRGRSLDLAISIIGLERNEVVRETIRSFVLTNPDSSTLQALAKQNRFFSGHLAHLAKADDTVPPQFHTWATNPPEGGEELQRAFEDLGWNIETIVRAINQLKTIENVDLSGVALSRIVSYTTDKPKPGEPEETVRRLDGISFGKGITFKKVNLEGANLAELRFEDATFQDTDFKDALLASIEFYHCTFSGSTSLESFRTDFSALNRTSKYYKWLSPSYAAYWYNCTIDVMAFFPALNPESENWQAGEQRYFSFFNCTWKVPGVTSPPPTPPAKQTGPIDPNAPQAAEPMPYPPKLILSTPGTTSNFDGAFSYP
jgi:hypothetical protein